LRCGQGCHLPSILALVDRLDGRPVHARHEVLILDELSDAALFEITAGGQTEDKSEMKLIAPAPAKDPA
jgi:hypothetical protein